MIDEMSLGIPLLEIWHIDLNSLGWVILGMSASAFKYELLSPTRLMAVVSIVLWAIFCFTPLAFMSGGGQSQPLFESHIGLHQYYS